MEDADVSILRDLDTHAPHDAIFRKLLTDTKWQQREMNMYGRKGPPAEINSLVR